MLLSVSGEKVCFYLRAEIVVLSVDGEWDSVCGWRVCFCLLVDSVLLSVGGECTSVCRWRVGFCLRVETGSESGECAFVGGLWSVDIQNFS